MLQSKYTGNYLNIYIFQTIAIVLGFVSLFVVIPHISENKPIYGIYTICISVTTFFAYADLGFLAAGVKYATERFSQNDRDGEYKYLGFSHFFLLVMTLLFAVIFIIFAINPHVIVNGLDTSEKISTASNLFLIIAVFAPTTVLQRLPQMILSIRVKQYLYQRVQIVGNVVKIGSVYYFFRPGHYDIVGYFLFTQIITLLCAIITLIEIRKILDYSYKTLFKYFRFTKQTFKSTYSLALSGLIATITWVLYYELDSIAIGKLLSPTSVAIYAVGFTILTFLRSLLGVFFSPFGARFNHFYAEGKIQELRAFFSTIQIFSLPIVVLPIIALIIAAKPFVYSWVGPEYESSVDIMQWLLMCNLLAFISYPSGMMMYAVERIKEMNMISLLTPIIFWSGVLFTLPILHEKAFAIFKLVAFTMSSMYYLYFTLKFTEQNLWQYLKTVVLPYVPAIITLVGCLLVCNSYFSSQKSLVSLFVNGSIIGVCVTLSMVVAILCSRQLSQYLYTLINRKKI